MNADLVALFQFSTDQWQALAPYLWLCGALAMATVAAALRASDRSLRVLALFALLPFAAWLLCGWQRPAVSVMGTSLMVDALTRACGAGVALLAALTALFVQGSGSERKAHPEWLALLLSATLGMALLPGARDWIAFFVYLEMLAVPGYLLAALDTERKRSLEAGVKYLLMGAFGSALLLMGMALIYGASASLDFAAQAQFAQVATGPAARLWFAGIILIVCAMAFKVALVPFHMWAADVYQGAPTAFAAFLAGAAKLSVFSAMLVSFSGSGFLAVPFVKTLIFVLGALAVLVGAFLAAAQTQLKRMLAYSGIANAGFAAFALLAGPAAASALLISVFFYALALTCALAVIERLAAALGRPAHEDIEGAELGRLPAMGSYWFLGLALFSLAGIPPLPGFLGKYLLLQQLWSTQHVAASVVLVLGSLLGLAYYLRVFVPLLTRDKGASSASVPTLTTAKLAALASLLVMLAATVGFGRLTQLLELGAR